MELLGGTQCLITKEVIHRSVSQARPGQNTKHDEPHKTKVHQVLHKGDLGTSPVPISLPAEEKHPSLPTKSRPPASYTSPVGPQRKEDPRKWLYLCVMIHRT